MATAKKAVKKATPARASKQSNGNGGDKPLMKWDEQLARRAKIAQATAANIGGGGGKSIGTQGGIFSVDGSEAGTELSVIMLDSVRENAYYGTKYDPDNPSIPVCFAFAEMLDDEERRQDEKEMQPHAESTNPQSESCHDCPHNKFGSADTGRGKACKNIVRMGVLDESDLEDIEAAEPRTLKVPVTSTKYWKSYTNSIIDVKKSDPIAVITEISLKRHPKFQFEMKFKNVGDVDGELIGALLEKSDGMQSDLMAPYQQFEDEEDEAPRGRGAGKALARGKGKPAPSKAPSKAAGRAGGRGR